MNSDLRAPPCPRLHGLSQRNKSVGAQRQKHNPLCSSPLQNMDGLRTGHIKRQIKSSWFQIIFFVLVLAKDGERAPFYFLSYTGQSPFMISSHWLLRSRIFPGSELSTHTEFFISSEVCHTCPPPWSQWPFSMPFSRSSRSGLSPCFSH